LGDRKLPDPEIVVDYGRGEPRGGGESAGETSIAIAQAVPAPWGAKARKRSSQARVVSAEADVDVTIAEVFFETKRLYYAAAIGQARARALTEAAEDAKSLEELVAKRVDAGEAPEGDQLRTRVEALRAEWDARSARSRAEGARASLNRFLLGALGPDFGFPANLEPRSLSMPPDDVLETAVARNPSYRSALSRIESAKWSMSKERAARLPALEFSAYKLTELDRQATGLGLGLAIPLWNRNEGAVLMARGALAEAESEALVVRTEIERDLERLVRQDRVARELATGYSERIIPTATESLTLARLSLEEGEATLLAWLEARRSYLEVLRASYDARLEAFMARAELERLTGDLDSDQRRVR
jgi:cobalt-zinc-cadmium efflux system outer membrane protein